MTEWLNLEVAAVIAALGVVSGVIGFIAKKVWPFISELVDLVRAMAGRPANPRLGISAEPGLIPLVHAIRADVDVVKQQVKNSHVTNLREDMDLMASKEDVAAVVEQVATLALSVRTAAVLAQTAARKAGVAADDASAAVTAAEARAAAQPTIKVEGAIHLTEAP